MQKILCFGDSNTWGYIPGTGERYPEGIRWTSLIDRQLGKGVQVIEEGLCGRTTVYEDQTRSNRKGIESLPDILSQYDHLDSVVLMLGTNDCKSYYKATAKDISEGIEKCLDLILDKVSPEKVVLVSPILLGEDVWKAEFDPEFDEKSVIVSRQLKSEYEKLANRKHVRFLAASDYVVPSKEDREHMNELGHQYFAKVLVGMLEKIIM